MKWGWTEEARRMAWPKWKARGKKAFLLHVGILRFGMPWSAIVLISELFFSPSTHELSIGEYVGILAITIFGAVLFGLWMGFFVWRAMMKKYG
jgi:hypothetical protein